MRSFQPHWEPFQPRATSHKRPRAEDDDSQQATDDVDMQSFKRLRVQDTSPVPFLTEQQQQHLPPPTKEYRPPQPLSSKENHHYMQQQSHEAHFESSLQHARKISTTSPTPFLTGEPHSTNDYTQYSHLHHGHTAQPSHLHASHAHVSHAHAAARHLPQAPQHHGAHKVAHHAASDSSSQEAGQDTSLSKELLPDYGSMNRLLGSLHQQRRRQRPHGNSTLPSNSQLY